MPEFANWAELIRLNLVGGGGKCGVAYGELQTRNLKTA